LQEAEDSLRVSEKAINDALERLNPKRPQEIAEDNIEAQLRHVRRRLYLWTSQIEKLLDSEKERIGAHAKNRAKLLHEQLASIPTDIQAGVIKLGAALSLIETTAAQHDRENESRLEPVISALESLAENINLDLLAADSSEEVGGLRTELDRLTALAQLGITVEIIDHELASFNSTIAHGLKQFPSDVQHSIPYKQVQTGYEGLATRLSFLSPLKLSGDPDYRHITGKDIEDYLLDFFATDLKAGSFRIVANASFRKFSIYQQRARIFPVFINLVNNARYWLHQRDGSDRTVQLSVVGDKVVISDNGPGIAAQDIPDLFRLFFTRRQGGRGIGLYLCRSNLAAGGHRISYATDDKFRLLDGANFVIEFREAIFPE